MFRWICAWLASWILSVSFAYGVCPDYVYTCSPSVERGFHNVLDQPYSLGPFLGNITQKEFDLLFLTWPAKQRRQAILALKESREKYYELAFERYGFLKSPYRDYSRGNAPLGFAIRKDKSWEMTCLTCHAGSVMGEVMVGLPNNQFDIESFLKDRKSLSERFSNYELERSFLSGLGFDFAYDLIFEEYDYSVNSSRGVADVWFVPMLNMAFRNKYLGPRSLDLLSFRQRLNQFLVGKEAVAMDPRPWWFVGVENKTHLFIDGYAPKDSKMLMQNTVGFLESKMKFRSRHSEFEDNLEFFAQLKSPKYPSTKIDLPLTSYGKKIFDRTCARCHGHYSISDNTENRSVFVVGYPNRVIPLSVVRTDPLRLTSGQTRNYKTFLLNSWLGDYGRKDIKIEVQGYVAPPLTGVWASAPYFHNGSVPTLDMVLNPSSRPKVWRVIDYNRYDSKRMGLLVEELDRLPQITDDSKRRRYYDTSQPSKDRSGHDFASGLSEAEKRAVLEYLKLL